MKFSDFKLLCPPVQAWLLCKRGVLLGERSEPGYVIALYQIDSFYVEVYYRSDDNEIIKLLSFHNTSLLESFLSTIPLPELLPLNVLA
ncbi:MAG: hypothetical protein JWP88_439 [Flaviaesturariibacter sp.]|nr:hypothetical protein [Flaviaesturariibacter sp.]